MRTFEDISGSILAAAVEVHRALGPGFHEAAYSRALRIALRNRGIRFKSEFEILLKFAGDEVGAYRLDLVVEDAIVVELKAVRRVEEVHFAQLRAYLRASGLRVGLLLNFNAKVLAVRRVVQGAITRPSIDLTASRRSPAPAGSGGPGRR